MQTKNIIYQHKTQELQGYLAFDPAHKQSRPAVLVVHDWSGRNAFACQKAEMLAKMGYVGFAIDMYGQGRIGKTTEEKMALMQPVLADRLFLRERIQQALNTLISFPEVNKNKIAAIGFCFGGLCVLDLARSGADVKGVVSFHGLLNKPTDINNQAIRSKVLVLHGYDDPMVKPQDVDSFCQEMTEAKVDWQVHQYGNTQHAFTNPEAHDVKMGTLYNPTAEHRSMQAMKNFLAEIFTTE